MSTDAFGPERTAWLSGHWADQLYKERMWWRWVWLAAGGVLGAAAAVATMTLMHWR